LRGRGFEREKISGVVIKKGVFQCVLDCKGTKETKKPKKVGFKALRKGVMKKGGGVEKRRRCVHTPAE